MKWLVAAPILFLFGCNDAVTGGNTANGDRSNYPDRGMPDGRQLSPQPTENDTGPWYGQNGLNDTTHWGTNDDRPNKKPLPPPQTPPEGGKR